MKHLRAPQLAAGLMALSLLFTGCAAGGTDVSSPTPDDSEIGLSGDDAVLQTPALPFDREDTLNPFTAASEVNWELANLLYDSLTYIDEGFCAQKAMADEITQTDPTHWTVTFGKETFSDGSEVTPEDVAASFKAAKASKNYQALLRYAENAVPDGDGVTFTLSRPDPCFAAVLSFPIIKAETATNEKKKAPIGGGLYLLDEKDGEVLLSANPHAPSRLGAQKYKTVALRHLPNADACYYGLASGSISFYYDDLNGGTLPSASGASASVAMNDLVYLGINGGRGRWSNATVRQALSSLLDRTELVNTSYSGWAQPGGDPFCPLWLDAMGVSREVPKRDLEQAISLMDAAGFERGDDAPEAELIYNQENSIRASLAETVRSQLAGAGLNVTVVPLSFSDYTARLKAGNYDFYLGEVRLAANMSLHAFLGGGDARYGVANGAATEAYTAYLAGESTLEDFLEAFREDVPYISLCWRKGMAAYDRRLSSVKATGYNPYYQFGAWE